MCMYVNIHMHSLPIKLKLWKNVTLRFLEHFQGHFPEERRAIISAHIVRLFLNLPNVNGHYVSISLKNSSMMIQIKILCISLLIHYNFL